MFVYVLVVVLILGFGYLLLRFNALWVYRLFDRALSNDRSSLPRPYELPRYYTLNQHGNVDMSVRWPGWDGWYVFMVPDDRALPVKMVRASVMTGLYGLEGIDNYDNLLLRLSTFDAVEHLVLIPTEERIGGRREKANYFSQHYLPKATDLRMTHEKLDATIRGMKVPIDEETEQYGRIRGTWPNYTFECIHPEAEVAIVLQYTGEHIVWWADVPHLFTYFAAFGTFDGKIRYKRGTSREDLHRLTGKEEVYSIKGVGCFEHGFARKPFNFDRFWLPITWLKTVVPSFKPIRYHYELCIGDDNHHGGFMRARGFGIDVRNRGGLYLNGTYKEIKRVTIRYLNDPEPDRVEMHCSGQPPVIFYRKWKVQAILDDGVWEYTGTREWPPVAIARNMIYYNFSYEGTYQGQRTSGRGYGEYAHM